MTRAVVLGGGGPVGIGWESGLAVGLAAEGVGWADADLIVGTSAGSVVGAQLALGMDLAAAVATVSAPLPVAGDGSAATAGMESLMAALGAAASGGIDPLDARITLGRIAMAAETVAEEDFIAVFSQVAGMAWPAGYRCTAIDVETGELRVWDGDAGVPIERAVASSCAVPAVFPPSPSTAGGTWTAGCAPPSTPILRSGTT
jgi:NTE family protein